MKQFNTVGEVKKERLLLKKAGNEEQSTLLGVLLAELDRRPDLTKEPTEQDIYKVIKKLYDAALECGNKSEEAYLEQFIKKQLTEEELKSVISQYIQENHASIGEVMKFLATNYAGQYDGKTASQIIRNLL